MEWIFWSVGDAFFIGMRQPKGVQSSQSFTIKIRVPNRAQRLKSAILHSVLIVQLGQRRDFLADATIRPHYVNIAWERAFALVFLATLFYQ